MVDEDNAIRLINLLQAVIEADVYQSDPPEWLGGSGSSFPTFTGAGSPEGSQSATAKNQSYVDSDTGDLWLYNGTPPSNTGWVNQAGGGGGAGSPVVRAFPFTFDTPDILTGAALYTPTVGDILLDAWIEIDTVWNGTTPTCDIGTVATFATTHSGLFDYLLDNQTGVDMTIADNDVNPGVLVGSQPSSLSMLTTMAIATQMLQVNAIAPPAIQFYPSGDVDWGRGDRVVPAKFVNDDDPFIVVVSQDGTNTGADPGSTQGAGILYLVTATPA
jgi:hypothetical protein